MKRVFVVACLVAFAGSITGQPAKEAPKVEKSSGDKAIEEARQLLEKAWAAEKDPKEKAKVLAAANRLMGTAQVEDAIPAKVRRDIVASIRQGGGLAKTMPAFKVGEFGQLPENTEIVKVVDKETVVVGVTVRGIPGVVASSTTYLVITGVDTSKMADKVGTPPQLTYYIVGNKMVGKMTVLNIVPFIPTQEERAAIGGK